MQGFHVETYVPPHQPPSVTMETATHTEGEHGAMGVAGHRGRDQEDEGEESVSEGDANLMLQGTVMLQTLQAFHCIELFISSMTVALVLDNDSSF